MNLETALDNLEFPQGVRCYNGAFDSSSQRVLDAQETVMKAIMKVEPEAHATFFPVEECTQVHVWGRPLSGICSTRGGAIREAYQTIKERQNG